MARNNRTAQSPEVQDYRHDDATRRNNPPAAIASQGRLRETPEQEYTYNPHLPPILRFDESGDTDQIPELLQKAQQAPLTAEEAKILSDALKDREPWLEWASKQEAKSFAVDPVALHIHERLSAKAILRTAARQDIQRELFADPQQEYHEAVRFYQHDVDWSNRLILGDSLTVMSSLAHREDLAGKVQMIYIDPPYGINYHSNFQPTVFQHDVKDRESDLTREREQIKAYRDTWKLGIHSYLAYLRDRLIVARELLTDSGSVFVQISDENVHRVRCLMDEVFESKNFIAEITCKVSSGTQQKKGPRRISDFILWYSKDRESGKFRRLYIEKTLGEESTFKRVELEDGTRRSMTKSEQNNPSLLPSHSRPFRSLPLHSQGAGDNQRREFAGELWRIPNTRHWTYAQDGFVRLCRADRVQVGKSALEAIYYFDDSGVSEITTTWSDTGPEIHKNYVVQTSPKIIERCILMTTDPGDLVLDPTCGSGTTAYVAEGWGRRWITIDTSRVAVALARQRLLTASLNYYKLKEASNSVASGFISKTVPHIELKSIAQNTALDPIFARHEPVLEEKLEALNRALEAVTSELRTALRTKLEEKERREGKKTITDADRRRWELPESAWKEWEVPFDTDPDWPSELQSALTDYRQAWREKMTEVNECIAAAADTEELVDQPEVDSKTLRVSGPFTVEAVQPAEESLYDDSPLGGAPDPLPDTFGPDFAGGGSQRRSLSRWHDPPAPQRWCPLY